MRHIRFLRRQFNKVKDDARKGAKIGGSEICGLILDNGYFYELIRVRNKSKHGGGFSFYFTEIRTIQKMAKLFGHEIVGTFHSHPVGISTPGESDLHNALDDSIILIYDVMGCSADLWHIKNIKSKRLKYSLL